jgi:hypothetical protein
MPPRHLLPALLLATTACFPTFQNARVEPGLRLDASATVLADQERDGLDQGTDLIGVITPAYGFRDRVEIGLPVGFYLEDGFDRDGAEYGGESRQVFLAPYLKVALLPQDRREHLALIAQTVGILPGNIGIRFGRDMGGWEPHLGVNWIFSYGSAGDDPVVPRYQQYRQRLLALSVGATWHTRGRPAVEVGLLRNAFQDGGVFGTPDEAAGRITLYDLFVGFRVGLAGR